MGRCVEVPKRLLSEAVVVKEPWRQELMDLLMEFVVMALHPSPYGLRQVAEVLMELRGIMLMDDLNHTLTRGVMEEIRFWVENTKRGNSYDLAAVLREIRERHEDMRKLGVENECQG